jgi:hypothetical protein
LYRPHRIVREARAEGEAEKIKALAGVEITEIQRRGVVRFIVQQGKQQANFESVVAQAIPDLEEDAKPDEIDNDWLTRFFEASKLISDKDMQSLWARLLAGEANKAGTFTKRTIEHVSNLEKRDAELFTTLCGFCCSVDQVLPLVYDSNNDIYKTNGLNFEKLTHLDDIGLVKFDSYGDFAFVSNLERVTVHYYGTYIVLSPATSEQNKIKVGKVLLTKVGQELAPISGSKPVDGFLDFAVNTWIDAGYVPFSPLPHRSSS